MQPKVPRFLPAAFNAFDPKTLALLSPADAQALALNADARYVAASDTDFRRRNPALYSAARQAEAQVHATLNGDLSPGLQAAVLRLSLAQTATPLADNAAPGSIGGYALARAVALNYNSAEQQALDSLETLNQLFPEYGQGLTGLEALNLQLDAENTVNGVLVENFTARNEIAIGNAVGQYQRDYAEYRREFARSQNTGLGFRILNGVITGAYEGYTYGSKGGTVAGLWGALGGAVGGGLDGAFDGPIYQEHVNNQATYLQRFYAVGAGG